MNPQAADFKPTTNEHADPVAPAPAPSKLRAVAQPFLPKSGKTPATPPRPSQMENTTQGPMIGALSKEAHQPYAPPRPQGQSGAPPPTFSETLLQNHASTSSHHHHHHHVHHSAPPYSATHALPPPGHLMPLPQRVGPTYAPVHHQQQHVLHSSILHLNHLPQHAPHMGSPTVKVGASHMPPPAVHSSCPASHTIAPGEPLIPKEPIKATIPAPPPIAPTAVPQPPAAPTPPQAPMPTPAPPQEPHMRPRSPPPVDYFTNSKIVVPSTPAPPETIVFNHQWSLYADDHPRPALGEAEYQPPALITEKVGTMEKFWRLWRHVPPPSRCPRDAVNSFTYCWFRHDVKPEWEHPKNKNGGSISFLAHHASDASQGRKDVMDEWTAGGGMWLAPTFTVGEPMCGAC